MKTTKKHVKTLKSFVSLLMVLFVIATGFGTKAVSAATNPQLLTAGKTKILDFDSSNYQIISNFEESSISYGYFNENGWDKQPKLEMETEKDYVVKYPKSLTMGDGTKLTVRVTVRLLQKSGHSKVMIYTAPDSSDSSLKLYGKVRIYWDDTKNARVQWTIELFKDENCTQPNTDYLVLSGLQDPDESNYIFDTTGKSVYYQQPLDGKDILGDDGYNYVDGTEGGFYKRKETTPNFDNALFLVDMKERFTFINQNFKTGAIQVPFFYDFCYNVSYDANRNGKEVGTGNVNVGPQPSLSYGSTQKTKNNTFTTKGYTFAGWNTVPNPTAANPGIPFNENADYVVPSPTGTNNSFNTEVEPGETVTLYAQWVPAYTVEYEPNNPTGTTLGGEPVADQVNKYNNPNTVSENTYTVEGYRFIGWDTKDVPDETSISFKENDPYDVANTFDTNNSFKKVIEPGSVVTLYAQWEPMYKVVYDANKPDGTTVGGKPVADQENQYNKPNTVSENTYTIDGYKFVGWNTVPTPTDADPGIPFDESVEYSVPSPTGTENSFKKEVAPGNSVTLYAQWVPSYTVKYVANSPTGSYTGEVPDQKNYLKEDNTISENGYAVTGYRFVGWNTVREITEETPGKPMEVGATYNVPNTTDIDNYFEQVVEPNGTVYIYAQWNLQNYKIHYDPNGGKGVMDSQLFTILDETMTSKDNIFTRDGYRFKGFLYTGKDGTTKLYTNINDFRNILIDPLTGPEITLVAQWEEIPQPSSPKYVPPVTGVE